MRKFLAMAALVLAPVLGLAVAAGSASADSADCASAVSTHNGVTGNYCGSQQLSQLNLELSVTNRAVPYSQLTVKPTGTNYQTDFSAFNPAVHPDNQKVFEYTPRGINSGYCAALSNNRHRLVLKACNSASPAQQFVANGPDAEGGYQWISELSGQAITAPGNAYSRVILATPVDAPGQSFSFVQ